MAPVRSYQAIMDLGNWLRSLGLQEFEAVFRENAIDETVLRDLTEDHLRELGFPLGVRLKLLKAVAEINANAELTTPPTRVTPALPHVDAAERRQVTVMFSDLVDSTALSARMDPEDMGGVLAEYRNCVGRRGPRRSRAPRAPRVDRAGRRRPLVVQ